MAPLNERGLVAISADPVTYGHLDLIRRAAAECKELVVLVANNPAKLGSYLFSIEERAAMVRRGVDHLRIPSVTVIPWSGLLVDAYLTYACDTLFRGVRNEKDLAYEEEQAEVNGFILPDIAGRIRFLEADRSLRLVSSSLVKTFVAGGLNTDLFVPIFVKQMLEERILRQYRVGITGRMGVGKSRVARELCLAAERRGIAAHHINIDQLLRDLYDESSEGARVVRMRLAARFGEDVLSDRRTKVRRARLAEIIFRPGGEEDRAFVTELTMPHIGRLYRRKLATMKGLVLVEWAQLAEMWMSGWTNHNVIVVDAPVDRATFLAERGLGTDRIASMDAIQFSAAEKVERLANTVRLDGSGSVRVYENAAGAGPERIDTLLDELITHCVPTLA